MIERRTAAEEVCWRLMILMAVGALNLPQDEREALDAVMKKWVDLAVKTGTMAE